jgi:hypothetical protein
LRELHSSDATATVVLDYDGHEFANSGKKSDDSTEDTSSTTKYQLDVTALKKQLLRITKNLDKTASIEPAGKTAPFIVNKDIGSDIINSHHINTNDDTNDEIIEDSKPLAIAHTKTASVIPSTGSISFLGDSESDTERTTFKSSPLFYMAQTAFLCGAATKHRPLSGRQKSIQVCLPTVDL